MNTKIYMVRHGETPWNINGRFQGSSDIPLNDKGREQAGFARDALAGVHFDAVYASPLKRAIETAQIICQPHPGLTIIPEPGFREQSVGTWEGHTFDELEAEHPGCKEMWLDTPAQMTFPEGERLAEVQLRALSAFLRVADSHPGQTLLIVSHMVCLSTMLDAFGGVTLDDIWLHPIANAGINIVEVASSSSSDKAPAGLPSDLRDLVNRTEILEWNHDEHLPEEYRRKPAASIRRIQELREAKAEQK